MKPVLKSAIAVAAIFALTAIGFCASYAALFFYSARKQALILSGQVQHTMQDADRAVQIAAGAINTARQIERDNRNEIAAVNRETLSTIANVNQLVVSFDATQKAAGDSIQQTSAELKPLLAQSAEDLRQVAPLLQQSTAIAANLNASTADVAHEIHKFVYPPPRKWYQKYIIDPAKIAAHLVTIPLR